MLEIYIEDLSMAMVPPKDALQLYFSKAFDFKTRATRAEFWIPTTIIYVGGLFFSGVAQSYNAGSAASDIFILIVQVLIGVPAIALTVRRLHDIDMSGWWLLLLPFAAPVAIFAEYIGMGGYSAVPTGLIIIAFYILMLLPSVKITNKYGPSPSN